MVKSACWDDVAAKAAQEFGRRDGMARSVGVDRRPLGGGDSYLDLVGALAGFGFWLSHGGPYGEGGERMGGRSTSSTAGASKFQGVNGTSERSDGGPFTYLALHPMLMIKVCLY